MFQTGGEKGHYTWDSHLLVAPPRVVGQKPDCSMLKENGREGGVSPTATIRTRILVVKGGRNWNDRLRGGGLIWECRRPKQVYRVKEPVVRRKVKIQFEGTEE